jgi:hypothetical protein
MTICIPSTTIWNLPAGTELDPDMKRQAETLAWTTLQSLTGFAMAICPIEARPCRPAQAPPVWKPRPVAGGAPFYPSMSGGAWINCACGGDAGCGCGVSWVQLPGYVGRIDEVVIGDTALDAGAYRVDGGSRLIRQDGEVWPEQNLSQPTGTQGTWYVRYFQGDAPTEIDDWAAGVLANEFLKALKNEKCRLPSGVTSIVRNGVTMQLAENPWLEGRTGIREVDMVIMQRNPHGLRQPTRIASPDSRRGTVTSWGA